jgi:hypothetical protein
LLQCLCADDDAALCVLSRFSQLRFHRFV